jgi:hypothetical protein
MKFRKYSANIFTLQRAALKIQHWFFNKRLHSKKITYVPFVPSPIKEVSKKSVITAVDSKPKKSDLKINDVVTSKSFTSGRLSNATKTSNK